MNSQYVVIEKMELMEGEELRDLPLKISAALTRGRTKLDRSLILTHVFKDHVVTKDTESRKMFRFDITRSEKGDIKLGQPIEVRPVFVPVRQAAEKAEDSLELMVSDTDDGHSLVAVKVRDESTDRVADAIKAAVLGVDPEEHLELRSFWGGAFAPR